MKLTDRVCEFDPVLGEEMQLNQGLLDTKIEAERILLEGKIKMFSLECHKLKEWAEVTRLDKEEENTTTNASAKRHKECKRKLERVPLPTFSEQMEDNPIFQDDWRSLVTDKLDEPSQLRQIRY